MARNNGYSFGSFLFDAFMTVVTCGLWLIRIFVREMRNNQMKMEEELRRLKQCVKNWPECKDGDYNPSCCRFPKSCSCMGYNPETISEDELEDK